MVTDLKVLVKSFNCEDRFCYIGNLRDSFFRAREKHFYSRKFRESGISESFYSYIICKGLRLLRLLPPAARGPAGEGRISVWFSPVWCVVLLDIDFSLHR